MNTHSLNFGVCQSYMIINNQRIPSSLQQQFDDPPVLCHRLKDFALRHYSCFEPQLSVPSAALNDSAQGTTLLTHDKQATQYLFPPPIKTLQQVISAQVPCQAQSFTQLLDTS